VIDVLIVAGVLDPFWVQGDTTEFLRGFVRDKSPTELRGHAGRSRSNISRLRNGSEQARPTFETWLRILNACGGRLAIQVSSKSTPRRRNETVGKSRYENRKGFGADQSVAIRKGFQSKSNSEARGPEPTPTQAEVTPRAGKVTDSETVEITAQEPKITASEAAPRSTSPSTSAGRRGAVDPPGGDAIYRRMTRVFPAVLCDALDQVRVKKSTHSDLTPDESHYTEGTTSGGDVDGGSMVGRVKKSSSMVRAAGDPIIFQGRRGFFVEEAERQGDGAVLELLAQALHEMSAQNAQLFVQQAQLLAGVVDRMGEAHKEHLAEMRAQGQAFQVALASVSQTQEQVFALVQRQAEADAEDSEELEVDGIPWKKVARFGRAALLSFLKEQLKGEADE
jgi:hypothetical protein